MLVFIIGIIMKNTLFKITILAIFFGGIFHYAYSFFSWKTIEKDLSIHIKQNTNCAYVDGFVAKVVSTPYTTKYKELIELYGIPEKTEVFLFSPGEGWMPNTIQRDTELFDILEKDIGAGQEITVVVAEWDLKTSRMPLYCVYFLARGTKLHPIFEIRSNRNARPFLENY